jgi:hypothetical protein
MPADVLVSEEDRFTVAVQAYLFVVPSRSPAILALSLVKTALRFLLFPPIEALHHKKQTN